MRDDLAAPDADAISGQRPARWTFADGVWLVAISLLAAVLRLLWIQQWSFEHGEAITWRMLTLPADGGGHDAVGASHPLVYEMLRWLVERGYLHGMGEGWLRLPFAFVGCVGVPLLAILGRPLVGRAAALLAALVLALHPVHLGASQTAEPTVVAVTVATLVGVLAVRGWRWTSLAMVVVAGTCQPIGWLAGIGMWLLGERERMRWPLVSLLLPALCAAVLLPLSAATSGLVTLALAAVALVFAVRNSQSLAVATLLPLAGGGIWWWFEARGGAHGLVASMPALSLLAAAGAVRCFEGLRVAFADRPRVGPVAGAAASVIWLGELATAAFLYFFVFAGARSPWRDAASAVLSGRVPGSELVVLAESGLEPLRTYLRPNHWRDTDRDLHPGIRVERLAGDVERLAGQLAAGAVLVLQHHELRVLERAPASASLLADYAVTSVWASPKPFADGSLYLLQLRAGE